MITTHVNPDSAVLLLAAAAKLGLDKGVVRQVRGRFTAPDEVFKEAGFTVDEDSQTAQAPGSEEKPQRRTAKKTVAKKAAAKKTAAAPPADGE